VYEHWSSFILMAKPEKRWSAFSIELRGANSWSTRTVCDAWRSVRAEFGIRRNDENLGIAQNLPTISGRPLWQQPTAACSYKHTKKIIFTSESYFKQWNVAADNLNR